MRLFSRQQSAQPVHIRTHGKHPDARVELELQRVLSFQDAITRYERLIAEYRKQMTDARDEEADFGANYRIDGIDSIYKRGMEAQRTRIAAAEDGMRNAEEAIGLLHDQIAELTAKLNETDLSFLF